MKVTLTFEPHDVSSVRTRYGSRLNSVGVPIYPTEAVSMNFQDLNNCTVNASDYSNIYLFASNRVDTIISGTSYAWHPCLPMLDIPVTAFNKLQPAWSDCVRETGAVIKGIWDPPIALTARELGIQVPTTTTPAVPGGSLEPPVQMGWTTSGFVLLPGDPLQPTGMSTPGQQSNTGPQDPTPSPDPHVGGSNPNQPPPSTVITIDNIPLTLLPSHIIVGPNLETITAGTTPFTIDGHVISIVSGSILVADGTSVTVEFPTSVPLASDLNEGVEGAVRSVWDEVGGWLGSNGTRGGIGNGVVVGMAGKRRLVREVFGWLVGAWGVWFGFQGCMMSVVMICMSNYMSHGR